AGRLEEEYRMKSRSQMAERRRVAASCSNLSSTAGMPSARSRPLSLGGKLARLRPPLSKHQKRGVSCDSARTEQARQPPPKTRSSLAPDYKRVRSLRLRASGLQRLAPAPASR